MMSAKLVKPKQKNKKNSMYTVHAQENVYLCTQITKMNHYGTVQEIILTREKRNAR